MSRKRFTTEQIIYKLRAVDVEMAKRRTIALVCKRPDITGQTYHHWRMASAPTPATVTSTDHESAPPRRQRRQCHHRRSHSRTRCNILPSVGSIAVQRNITPAYRPPRRAIVYLPDRGEGLGVGQSPAGLEFV